jgi:predicted transcriptional regulator
MTKPWPPEGEPSIFGEVDEEAEHLADERAEADLKAGRLISHEAMKRWLLSWGASHKLPPPKCGE